MRKYYKEGKTVEKKKSKFGMLSVKAGIDKNLFWAFPGTADMVYKFMDPCMCEYFWYKGHTNF